MRKTIYWSIIGGIVATIAVIAMLLSLLGSAGGTGGAQGAQTGSAEASTASEQPVAQRPDCPADGVGGITLPCLGGDNGAERSADAADGVTVVNVWAWWCGPCRGELPLVQEFAENNPQYTVVGVQADVSASRGAALLEELGVDLPSYQDSENSFAGTLGLPGVIPITVVFNGSKQIAMFATPFTSTEDIQSAVDRAVADAGLSKERA